MAFNLIVEDIIEKRTAQRTKMFVVILLGKVKLVKSRDQVENTDALPSFCILFCPTF